MVRRWWVCPVLFLLIGFGCARAPAPQPPAVTRATDTHELSLDEGFITIRIDVPREPPGPRPVVISLLGEREPMLAMGLAVVEYRLHWELVRGATPAAPPPAATLARKTWGTWLLASPSPKTVGEGYFRIIDANATQTVPRVIDAIADVPGIDLERLGIAGTSTNGFTALRAVAADRRITAAAIISACGDYHRFLYGSSLAMHGEFLDLGASYEAWLHAVEPIRHPESYTHAALLFVNGESDQAIPIACARETERVFTPVFARAGVANRLRFVVLSGVGHALPDEARRQVAAWWLRWLVPERTSESE